MTRTNLTQILPIVAGLVAVFFLRSGAMAHEPVFSLGPETIFKGGVGIETEVEFEKADEERGTSLHYEVIYGLTENLSLTAEVPHVVEKREGANITDGLGEVALRAKYQVFRKDTLGAQDKAALIYGVKFPTGSEDREPRLGSGSVDHLFGLSLGHESTTWYGFATGRYVLRPEAGTREKGDRVLLDVAGGFRPWLRPYKSWDLVVLLETSYEHAGRDQRDGLKLGDTGGHRLLSGPTVLWSIRNVMIKGGVQLPLWHDLNGDQEETEWRGVLALEYHF